jgi:putative sigma-54 modulation protein
MRVTVTGRHMGVTGALKEYCEEKAGKLARFYDRIQAVEVILDGRSGVHTAEIIVHTDRAEPFVAKEQHEDAYAAVDLLLDKIERQLTRHKERVRNRKHPPRGTLAEPAGPVESEEEPDELEDVGESENPAA